MKKTIFLWPLLLIAFLAGACGTAPELALAEPSLMAPATETAIPLPTFTQISTETPVPLPTATHVPLHPLQIEAMRAVEYPGSDIVIESVLDPGVNYDRYYVSYLSE